MGNTTTELKQLYPEHYCPDCGTYMKATKLSNWNNRFCKTGYKLYTEKELEEIRNRS